MAEGLLSDARAFFKNGDPLGPQGLLLHLNWKRTRPRFQPNVDAAAYVEGLRKVNCRICLEDAAHEWQLRPEPMLAALADDDGTGGHPQSTSTGVVVGEARDARTSFEPFAVVIIVGPTLLTLSVPVAYVS